MRLEKEGIYRSLAAFAEDNQQSRFAVTDVGDVQLCIALGFLTFVG